MAEEDAIEPESLALRAEDIAATGAPEASSDAAASAPACDHLVACVLVQPPVFAVPSLAVPSSADTAGAITAVPVAPPAAPVSKRQRKSSEVDEPPTKKRQQKGSALRWTTDEEQQLLALHGELGPSWQTIAERLGTSRTSHGVAQHYKVYLRKNAGPRGSEAGVPLALRSSSVAAAADAVVGAGEAEGGGASSTALEVAGEGVAWTRCESKAVRCYAMLCYATLRYAMLCYAMLWYASCARRRARR
jgi:hypothetical protein